MSITSANLEVTLQKLRPNYDISASRLSDLETWDLSPGQWLCPSDLPHELCLRGPVVEFSGLWEAVQWFLPELSPGISNMPSGWRNPGLGKEVLLSWVGFGLSKKTG